MIALITGSSKGIGLAIAHTLADKGYNLVLCSRNHDEINAVAKEISSKNNIECTGYQVDMSKSDEVKTFGKQIISKYKSIDVLVNNAGVFYPGELLNEEEGKLESMINTNLYSAYHLTRIIAPTMVSKQNGHIFNICSVASIVAYPNGGSYSISKFALLGFSKVLREELKQHSVKVTSILPGATWSNSWKGVDLPEDRLMQADDIAKLVGNALELSASANIEEIIIRPQLGDL